MADLVSIIVPVYNLEDYIENCLNSILNQTYSNIEILCIDDGSSDSSSEKIKSLAEKDNRIIYIYKENGGVSSARNSGLDNAKGEYIMFVDGDDYIHPQAVEIFVRCITETKSDVVCADSVKTKSLRIDFENIDNCKYRIIQVEELYNNSDNRQFATVWSKLFCADILKSERFPLEIKYGEDTNFMLKVLSKNPKLSKIDYPLYCYYTRENSAETSSFGLNKATVLDSYDNICEHFKTREDSDLKSFALQYLFQTICYIRTLCIGTEYEEIVLEKCNSIGKKWIKNLLKCNNLSFKNKTVVVLFFYSRHLYEFARLIADPTMKDFYKNRRKH